MPAFGFIVARQRREGCQPGAPRPEKSHRITKSALQGRSSVLPLSEQREIRPARTPSVSPFLSS